jgi:vacuolar-type H+-ATPase subunit F/Vma7
MIIFIGDRESAKPYSLFGFKTQTAETAEEAKIILDNLPGEVSAVFITEELFAELKNVASRLSARLIAVPGTGGSKGEGERQMNEMLKKALGTEVPD